MLAVGELLALNFNGDRPVFEIEVLALKSEQLAAAQPAEGGRENEGSVPQLDEIGELEHLLQPRQLPLRRAFGPCTANRAGVRREERVVDRSVEDRVQQAVALRGGARTRPALQQRYVPRPDVRCSQPSERHMAEGREDVQP